MLEQHLQHWSRWGLQQRPVVEGKLGLGLTNSNYLIRSGERRLVLRINHIDGATLGIDRRREQRILAQVSAAGIAPRICHNDPQEGILITEYIQGVHWPVAGGLCSQRRRRLLQLMDVIHSSRFDLPSFDYLQYAESYWQRLQARSAVIADELQRQRARMQPLLQEFQSTCCCQTLCHHDPVAANIIDADGRLYMIDWEYAGRGCRAFDYAALGAQWGEPLTPDGLRCNRQLAGEVYQYLCTLWLALRRGS